jgi:acetoin utilization deacetylase AcuC-like enzyme
VIPVFHHPGFAAPIGENHMMPMRKFALVAAQLRGRPAAQFHEPEPIAREDLRRVHTEEYIRAVETGEPRALAESQKFPWSPQLFPAVRLTNGGVLAAARAALQHGVAACLASGFHHSSADHGEGFCTFNGLVIALSALQAEGRIKHGAVLDLDLHYGNGTAQLAASRPFLTALSIYGSDYWQNKPYNDLDVVRHHDGENHFSVPLPNQTRGPEFRQTLERSLPLLLSRGRPDLLLYQAGADPLREDPYSALDLGHDDLMARDRRVFEFCRQHQIPVAWVLAGGYTKDTSKVVQVHVNTFLACESIYP